MLPHYPFALSILEIKKKKIRTHTKKKATRRRKLSFSLSLSPLKARRNSLVDGSKETNCSIPSEIVYRRLYRGRQLNRNFIFHSNIVTINRRDSRNCRDKQSNPRSAKTSMTERALCIRNFEESSSNSNFYETFPPYLSGIRVSVSARKKKAARRFQRHKGADLTSAFFPPSARIFITEETGALKFFSRLLAQLPLPTLTPFLPREFLQTIHSPRRGCICRYNAVEIAGELPASIFARRFKRPRFFETLLLHSSRFSNEGMIPVIGKKANNFTLQDIIRIFFKFTIVFF